MTSIAQFSAALRYLREKVDPQIHLQHIDLFILIATREGLSQSDLVEATGSPDGTVSRLTKTLVEYDLIVKKAHPIEHRRKCLYLSKRGEEIAKGLLARLN